MLTNEWSTYTNVSDLMFNWVDCYSCINNGYSESLATYSPLSSTHEALYKHERCNIVDSY
jgi:hypothetical protein